MRKNAVIILGDCVRADYLYDDDSLYIPTIDLLRSKGTTFKNAITAAPWTNPSLASLFTGIYSHKLDLYRYRGSFRDNVKLMQEYFREQGYSVGSFFATKKLFSERRVHEEHTARDIPKILKWFEQNREKPFFLFLHYWQTHPPYFYRYSKEGWYESRDRIIELLQNTDGREKVKELYKHSLERFSEEFVYSVVDKLKSLNIFENTHLILTADHGESFESKSTNIKDFDLFSMHGKFLYQEIIKVPLIYSGPDIPQGYEIKTQVRTIDNLPTLLELHQIGKDDTCEKIDGKSLTYVWNKKEIKDRLAIVSTTYAYYPTEEPSQAFSKFAALDRNHKVIYSTEEDNWRGYDLIQDPKETNPLPIEASESFGRLKEQLAKEVPTKVLEAEEQRVLKECLRNLGYF